MLTLSLFRRMLRPARFDGRVGPVVAGRINGWLVDRQNPYATTRFTLLLDGVAVGDFETGILRPSLSVAGYGNGRHGFSIPVEAAWCGSAPRRIAIRPAGARVLGHSLQALLGESLAANTEQGGRVASADARGRSSGKFSARGLLWPNAEANALTQQARRLFKEKAWGALVEMVPELPPFRKADAKLHLLVGRGLIYERQYEEATRVLAAGAGEMQGDDAWQFYYAIALSRSGRHEQGLALLQGLVAEQPRTAKYVSELANALRNFGKSLGSTSGQARQLFQQALQATEDWIRLERGGEGELRARILAARLFHDLRQFEDAAAQLDQVLEAKPGTADALWLRSQCLVSVGRVSDALLDARALLAINPAHQGAAYQIRILQGIAGSEGTRPPPTAGFLDVAMVARQGLLAVLQALDVTWVVLAPLAASDALPDPVRQALLVAPPWAGRLIVPMGDGTEVELWRAALLTGLAASGFLAEPERMSEDLAALSPIVATQAPKAETAMVPLVPGHGQRVVCMSRHGIVRFGGGEHFLESMACHYETMGFRPLVVGARSVDAASARGVADGRDYAFLPATDAALRRLFIEERPAFVHVLSGLGFEVAAALEFLAIPFVYGVHFWRDCLGTNDMDVRHFADGDSDPIPRKAFRYVIGRAAALYANSAFTRGVLEQAFKVRTPVVYSLPEEVAPVDPDEPELVPGLRNYVLLLNAKAEKGFDLLLKVAARLPHVPFLAVASQSSRDDALALVRDRGLGNVHILERSERTDLLYRDALVVAVPSYQFVETFSRVCIEAHRHGRPVIGSDKGNVPFLLHEAGVVLPERADRWAEEISRLHDDPGYRARREALALQNSARYAYRLQEEGIRGIVSSLGRQVLIAVGSGVGNMLHVGPMIRNIVRRLGCKVDIVVAEEYSDSLFLLHDPQYVNAVFSLGHDVLDRYYDVVLVTSCFGDMRPAFAGCHVLYARDWQKFEPAGPLHEAVYNLECARVLLGIDYDERDAEDYYLGEIVWQGGGARPLIGFHGGSKTGFWASKRWPGYAELARRLDARGFECASFGTEAEYVEGTIDMTGGSIPEMARAMMACRYFVSNDSGVMNIANAMGLPVTGLFAPTNVKTRGPLRATSSSIALEKDCSPCEVREAGRAIFHAGECRCIGEISVDQVEAHIIVEMTRLGLLPVAAGAAVP